jgi:hypothetical protein
VAARCAPPHISACVCVRSRHLVLLLCDSMYDDPQRSPSGAHSLHRACSLFCAVAEHHRPTEPSGAGQRYRCCPGGHIYNGFCSAFARDCTRCELGSQSDDGPGQLRVNNSVQPGQKNRLRLRWKQPSLCCIPEAYGSKNLSFGAVRVSRLISQVKSACMDNSGRRILGPAPPFKICAPHASSSRPWCPNPRANPAAYPVPADMLLSGASS